MRDLAVRRINLELSWLFSLWGPERVKGKKAIWSKSVPQSGIFTPRTALKRNYLCWISQCLTSIKDDKPLLIRAIYKFRGNAGAFALPSLVLLVCYSCCNWRITAVGLCVSCWANSLELIDTGKHCKLCRTCLCAWSNGQEGSNQWIRDFERLVNSMLQCLGSSIQTKRKKKRRKKMDILK